MFTADFSNSISTTEAQSKADHSPVIDLLIADAEECRTALRETGFVPVPVSSPYIVDPHTGDTLKGAGKRPLARDWHSLAMANQSEPADPSELSTGIVCDGLRAVDVDVDNPEDARRCRALAEAMLGAAPVRFRENSDRVLLLYRAAEGAPRKLVLTGEHHDPAGISSRIEVLGAGQQFVAFGMHPSGVRLEWEHDKAPAKGLNREDLPAVTEDQVTAFLSAAETIIGRKPRGLVSAPTKASSIQREAPPGGWPETTVDQVRECLALIPATEDYDLWIKVGAAVASVDDGADGMGAWLDWSSCARNYEERAARQKWRHVRYMDSISFGTLVALAREACGDPAWTPSRTTSAATLATVATPLAPAVVPKPPSRLRFLTAEEAEDLAPPDWLVPGLIQKGALAAIYGPPGSCKSFLALAIANAVAHGAQWRREAVEQGRVIYIAAEGGAAVGALRNKAWHLHHRRMARDSWLDLIPHAINLADPVEVDEFIALAKARHNGGYALVVVDTFARCSPGAEEQSAKETGLVIAACDRIRDDLGCAVLLIHHSGKDVGRGLRGSSAILGALDMSALVDRNDRDLRLIVQKQKDAEEGDPLEFRTWVQNWHDGDVAKSSLVIVDADGTTPATTSAMASDTRLEVANRMQPGDYSLSHAAEAMGKARGRYNMSLLAHIPQGDTNPAIVIRQDGREVAIWIAGTGRKARLHVREV